MKIRRGDIFFADLSPVVGSEQGGIRPVVVIQNDVGNRYSPTIIVAAITSQTNKSRLPTHVLVNAHTDLPKHSVILLEQIRTIDKRRLRERVGSFDAKILQEIEKALCISLGILQS
uniref:type II toxin-antitoxin system PemK/MazF family toxin n=1 Tax=Ndongobacter massiliensis TaxID=1871025 RepID=UPI000930E24A|nr:type II toxin-antitoxin system PemK/MazF family toxin [Ndongobacter massiliensis]